MLILGIDPGVRKLGYALVDYQSNSSSGPAGQKTIVDCGILFDDTQIAQRLDWYTKMGNIMEFFRDLTSKHHIEVLGIEKLYFTSKNQSNAEFVYGIRSSLILHFLAQGTKLIEIDPVQVKKYISGNAKASKELVQAKIMQLYGLQNLPQYNDSADALGMAWIAKTIA